MELLVTRKILQQVGEAPGKDIVEIKESERTPKVYMDKNQGIIKFSGRAMPDNAKTYFGPLVEWIEKYVQEPQDKTHVSFDLEYFNSSASKMILQIFKTLSKIEHKNKELKIEWYYMEDDDDMLESGKTFEELSDLNFEYIVY
ncbi:MAG: DUF1987 domain-containing protein [Bacteroidales bacterium]